MKPMHTRTPEKNKAKEVLGSSKAKNFPNGIKDIHPQAQYSRIPIRIATKKIASGNRMPRRKLLKTSEPLWLISQRNCGIQKTMVFYIKDVYREA